MREAKYTKPLTIALPDEVYEFIKEKTDELKISLSEWFREAAVQKIKSDENKREDKTNEKKEHNRDETKRY